MKYTGKAFVFGDYIDTDRIYPSPYMVFFDPETLAAHSMEGCDETFARRIKEAGGGIVVVGRSFGTGSAREQAPLSLKYAGVKCVVGQSFNRAFLRNSVNIGLPLVIVPEGVSFIGEGHQLEVDLQTATVRNLSNGQSRQGKPLPGLCRDILAAGGAIAYFTGKSRREG